jgi:hypothetical protein
MFHVVVSLATIARLAFADAGGTSVSTSADAPPPARTPAVTVVPFRTDAAPRIDPVFGDVTSLRAAIDRFLSLQGEMDHVRDDFSSAVHATLATLVVVPAPAPTPADAAMPGETRGCPLTSNAPYARAAASGVRYLALGQQMQAAYREIRRGEDLGDVVGLTPDYRLKVKKARELHQQLLSDYREMRVAFYDQLGAEMRHAGCRQPPRGAASSPLDPNPVNPLDPDAWELADGAPEAGAGAPSLAKESALPSAPSAGADAVPTGAAPAIWIDVDNTLCNEPTRLSIDGQTLGDIGARNKTSVRARSGPHQVCALPASDRRACGDAGTLRRAYLHEGWRLTIHCIK